MAERIPPSVSFETPTSVREKRMKPWRRFFNRFQSSVFRLDLNQNSLSPNRQRRMLHGEDEEQTFTFANTRCLSSYYSVFVARLAIMVMLAILIGLLTILTWHFTKVYTTRSLNSLAYGLRFELLQRPILRMWNILNSTVEITMAQVKLSEYVIDRYEFPGTHTQQYEKLYEVMRDITWALFASRKALNAITISYRNGFVQAFHRDQRSNSTFYIYSDLVNSSYDGWHDGSLNHNTSGTWYREPLDPITGEKAGIQRQVPRDDLINIAGISELRDGGASWHIAVSKFTDSPLLSAALPVRNSNGTIMAVVGVTTALYSVGQLMRELVLFHSGYMYLTTQEGYVLATSTGGPLLRNTTSGPELMMAVDTEDHIIRTGAEWLQETYGNKLSLNHEVHAENILLGHHKYYIDSFFLNLKRLPLVGVIIIPRKYIMGKIDQRALTTLVILISASLCILAIGCVCIMILTSGVSKEMKLRAELISHFEARRRAEASNNYKSQFLANMSHELRTPMAAVIGLLDILICDDCLTNEQFATVTQIRKCSTALLRLLNNILDISKVESGKLVLEEAEFDLGRELEGLVDMFSVQSTKHNVETVLDLADDMPKLVLGDSARVVQIFANLISNSIKFTSSGHVILRGWCEHSDASNKKDDLYLDQNRPVSVLRTKSKQHGHLEKGAPNKDNRITLRFEVDDTGCGIDPSKWESVFESFEQADPSTTRTYGGTGLGLCIVRTLVNKMGGEIKVVKKNGTGTLMQLYLVLSSPSDDPGQQCQIDLGDYNMKVLLALNGSTGRFTISKWLRKNRVATREASDWNELTQILQEVFQGSRIVECGFATNCSTTEALRQTRIRNFPGESNVQNMMTSNLIIVVDIGLLDLSTDIWKEQLNFLDIYHGKANFAWVLNHDTSSAIKMELRGKGHPLMVNRPLYKGKMIQILEAIVQERNAELQRRSNISGASTIQDLHECLEIDQEHFEAASSDDSDASDMASSDLRQGALHTEIKECKHPELMDLLEDSELQLGENFLTKRSIESSQRASEEEEDSTPEYPCQIKPLISASKNQARSYHMANKNQFQVLELEKTAPEPLTPRLVELPCKRLQNSKNQVGNRGSNQQDCTASNIDTPSRNSLAGLSILLAEDTPVLQRVATIMLEKMGARVTAVGDGMQAVESLKCTLGAECQTQNISLEDDETRCQAQFWKISPFDLILMDCQMPKMDGYEATKAIRSSEAGTSSHIPIVALTAHAMSSDEAKCLEVGMDAYLTKPIDCKLMVSTILSLTKGLS